MRLGWVEISGSYALVSVYWVPQERVAENWQLGRYYIEKACKRGPGTLDPAWLREGCEIGSHQYFVALKNDRCVAAAVTRAIDDTRSGRVLEWLALGGDSFKGLSQFEGQILEAAKRHGCTVARSFARNGWKRLLKDWTQTGVILEKVID